MTNPISLDSTLPQIKQQAAALGFPLCGVSPAVSPNGFPRLLDWIDRGYAGEMHYFQKRASAYEHPSGVLEGTRSLIVLGMPYRTAEPIAPQTGQGRVARYAWGTEDYHDVIHDRLKAFQRWFADHFPDARTRGVVDTAPLLEREFATLAGLGWAGKNTLLLNKRWGSYFFLAALLTDLELPSDEPHATAHCGSCRACLDACPTQAFVEPGLLDATRCISYLTIELRSPVPRDLRDGIGDWLFGCDVCQEVCPWNRRAPTTDEPAFQAQADLQGVDLVALFELDDEAFRQRFRRTPLWRIRRRGLLRNAAIVLGNQRDEGAVPILVRTLGRRDQEEAIVRGAAAWALGKIGSVAARDALRYQSETELDSDVLEEIMAALGSYIHGT